MKTKDLVILDEMINILKSEIDKGNLFISYKINYYKYFINKKAFSDNWEFSKQIKIGNNKDALEKIPSVPEMLSTLTGDYTNKVIFGTHYNATPIIAFIKHLEFLKIDGFSNDEVARNIKLLEEGQPANKELINKIGYDFSDDVYYFEMYHVKNILYRNLKNYIIKSKNMKENKIIYLREVNDNQITILENVKKERNIKTITGALKYVIEDYQSICSELQSTKTLLFKQTKELEKIQEEQKKIKKAWKTILKIIS